MSREDRVRTTIYISEEVRKHAKDNKINLSEWLNTEYIDKYLSIHSKIKELEELSNLLDEKKKEIQDIKDRGEFLDKSLTDRETRFIASIPSLKKQGKDMQSLCKRFNTEFKRNYSIEDFITLVDFYSDELQKRLSYAISRKKGIKS